MATVVNSYIYEQDPGHGWLHVNIMELKRLNIEHRISVFSYVNGDTAYLEEDCDMSIFLDAKKAHGEAVLICARYVDNTPILNYYHYRHLG